MDEIKQEIKQEIKHETDSKANILSQVNPPSDFLGPKCALWDCQRSAQGSADYCSTMHAEWALLGGGSSPGMNPVPCRKGIGLTDDILLSSLKAKMQGKNVGIPECDGAALKTPWKASNLFDSSLLKREKNLEWFFFDEPRKAPESGKRNRKRRSLSDDPDRRWHESRNSMKEPGQHMRSFYMDPQPTGPDWPADFEWHLFEYTISMFDSCALYKLRAQARQPKEGEKEKK